MHIMCKFCLFYFELDARGGFLWGWLFGLFGVYMTAGLGVGVLVHELWDCDLLGWLFVLWVFLFI